MRLKKKVCHRQTFARQELHHCEGKVTYQHTPLHNIANNGGNALLSGVYAFSIICKGE